MTEENDETDTPAWPPNPMKMFQEVGEQATRQQQELFRQMVDAGSGGLAPQLSAMSQTATFKTRVQSGGRISIPDAEREALDIEEGDIVQTIVIPVKRKRDTNE